MARRGGAFVTVGVLILLTGLWPRLGALVSKIPVPLAQAMLAGVLLPLCAAPVVAFADSPAQVAPVVLVWLVVLRYNARWAVPAAFAAAAAVIAADLIGGDTPIAASDLIPRIDWTVPHWSWQATVGIAVPLYIVTMASQNIPGTTVMASFGFRIPWRASMTVTGTGTVLGAFAGGHTINLAAISAALSANPSAHPDPKRRWVAAFSAGSSYLVLALLSTALATLVAAAPAGVVETVAGLALLGTLAASLFGALEHASDREATVLTFLVAASGLTFAGIGSAFWALVVGLVVRAILRRSPRRCPLPTPLVRVTFMTDQVNPGPELSHASDFPALWPVTTRWDDNDHYGHVNNVTYYAYFDTAVNGWLMERRDSISGHCRRSVSSPRPHVDTCPS